MFGSFGMMELLLILIIVLIVFGAGKLPQLGEGIGKAIKGFKRSVYEPEPVDSGGAAQVGAPPPEARAGPTGAEAPLTQDSRPREVGAPPGSQGPPQTPVPPH